MGDAKKRRIDIHCRECKRVALSKGDLLTIVDKDGGAYAQLAVINDRGENELKLLGLTGLKEVTGHTSVRQIDFEPLSGWLNAQGAKFTKLKFVHLFSGQTMPLMDFTCRVNADCTLIISNPMHTDALQNGGGGDLQLTVSNPTKSAILLPDPIGRIKDEFTVDRATARAYEVQTGEYVQVIDVQGRQCSDFMALRTDALNKGLERYIDSTVTRTFVGGAYPTPGLFDKFYDQDMRPLVSVVRDTVGRHDTFALACTERGYEERGFPGHINCSDNISHAFDPFGIEARKAWPAINFFFNSWIHSHDNQLQSDEAWSRPGDHVVMKALTDLVCVTTACPDDIDPINGWNPTDIHVRIYHADNELRRAIAHRPYPDSEPVMTEESAFHTRTSALTQSFSIAGNVWAPTSYDQSRALTEYWTCRESVTIQDMSSLRKYDIKGPDAEKLLQLCLSRNMTKLSLNRAVYALMLSDSGAVIDDGTLFRLGDGLFRWCCGSEDSALQLKQIATEQNLNVSIKAFSTAMPSLALQGPKSRELLQSLIFTQPHQPALSNIKWFGFTFARLHDREGAPFMLSRTGFTGELGYEIFCHEQHAEEIWDAVMAAGEAFGILPMGLDALELIRVEAGLMAAGSEFSPDSDAIESGLEFAVDFSKEFFIGREALKRNQDAVRRKLVGLYIEGNETPNPGAPIYSHHVKVGVVTSAVRSPTLQREIAMARIDIEHAESGNTLEIGCLDGQMKRLAVAVTEIPFVDPRRTRARA
jgi:aminomethyltransferase